MGSPLRDDELGHYLRTYCNREQDRKREKEHLLRDALFHDGGLEEVKKKVCELFERTIAERINKRIDIARYSNATKLVVGEMSTVYAEPASREVGGSPENQARYDALLASMQFDEEMEHINDMFSLHRAIIVAPRVRWTSASPSVGEGGAATIQRGSPDVVIDVHSAATARPVMHPNDNTLVVAWLTRCQMRTQRGKFEVEAHWLLTSDHEWEYLDKDFNPIPRTNAPHGYGVNPWIAITSGSKATPDFWPGDDGEDLVAAHVTGLIVEALLVKETNTASRIPVVSGDTSLMARNQDMDSSGALVATEGVNITTVEIGTDVEVYLKTADHSLQRVGNNYGLSMAVLKHEGAASADARELQLAPVRLRRRKQVKRFRRFEHALAERLSMVAKAAATPDMAFDVVEWLIDFGEPQVVMSAQERLALFERKRGMGLDNTPDFYRRENPDIDDKRAWDEVLRNIRIETERNVAMRPLQIVSGSLGAEVPSLPMPAENPQRGVGQGPVASRGDDFGWVKEAMNAA